MRQKKWVVKRTPGDYRALGERYGLEPMLFLLAKNRGVEERDFEEFFYPSEDKLHDPALLKDADKAVKILHQKISEHKKIRIIGDYDIDGVCATTILTDALKRLGADVDYAVPHRINDGYGLNMNLVDSAVSDGIDTVVTCDNGIAAFSEIEYAVSQGMTVIVTDHHEIPYIRSSDPKPSKDSADNPGSVQSEKTDEPVKIYRLPPAQAVIDIKREDETYPFKDICGAAVAWKLVVLLEREMGADIGSMRYIEPAGFATIGDVMKLQGENRTLASLGLSAMKHSSFAGFRALMRACQIEPEKVCCSHVGFRLGPCINATGRLDSADRAVKLLMEEDEEKAFEIAMELNDLNSKRQELTEKGVAKAEEQIINEGLDKDNVLVVYLPDIHESIAGIIAGRLKESCYKPAIVLTDGEECVKGSGRSIEGYSMFDKLSECRDLFIKFGGHPMAAGMSLSKENVEKLRSFLNQHDGLDEETLTEKIYIDAVVPFSYLNVRFIETLERLEPVGNGNSGARFAAKNVSVLKIYRMGEKKQHIRMELSDGSSAVSAVMWNRAEEFVEYMGNRYSDTEVQKAMAGRTNDLRVDILYSPGINTWNGTTSVQPVIRDYK